MATTRKAILADIASEIDSIRDRQIVRVAVDGVDGAGKTTFADELADFLAGPVIRASVDSFHNPRAIRYARGKSSPVGFFADSFNYARLKALLLDPLSSEPATRYCCAFFDHRADAEVEQQWHDPPARGVLVFDGIFAHRPELVDYWDYSVFLDVTPQESVRRCIEREGVTGISYDPSDPAHTRYVAGQAIYLEQCDPMNRCTRHIVNEPLDRPRLVTRPGAPTNE